MSVEDYVALKAQLKSVFGETANQTLENLTDLKEGILCVKTPPNSRARYGKLMFIFIATSSNYCANLLKEETYRVGFFSDIYFYKGTYDLLMGISDEEEAIEYTILTAIQSVQLLNSGDEID